MCVNKIHDFWEGHTLLILVLRESYFDMYKLIEGVSYFLYMFFGDGHSFLYEVWGGS